MADIILGNLVQQLSDLAIEEYKVFKGVGDELNSLEKELRFMKKFLRNSEEKQQEHELVRELVDQIREVAFEAEDVIETFLLNVERQRRRTTFGKVFHGPEHALLLRKVAKQIGGIKTSIDEIYANKDKYGIEMGEGTMNPHFEASLQRWRKDVDEEMVGFVDAADSLLKQLIEGSAGLEVISIVGMDGLGKTTIAKKLYNDRLIRDHFPARAWVSVSEDYNTHESVLNILERMMPDKEGIAEMSTEKLKVMLKGHLKDRKYIVFLDDVWQPHMWDEVKACFTNNGNGSRIVITTRMSQVARHASPREPHFLRFFTPTESWELFVKKVFHGYPCPSHLIPLGTEIVKRCKGLPLSIAVIASMLGSQEKSQRIWERTLKDVSVHLGKDKACLEILALSYHSLPVELKPCFLNFAAFPEDHEMVVRRLIALWLSEGFIQPLGELSVEEVAESYLDNLIDRSLVQAGIRRTDGGLKTCRVHDLIRDLCIREAKRENFMGATSKIEGNYSATNKWRPRRISVHRRLTRSIQSKDWDPSSVRALLSFDTQGGFTTAGFWKKFCIEYNLLRVLDLGAALNVTTMPNDMGSLLNLRYLRLFLSSSSVPNSVFELWNLQMLFIEGNQSIVIHIGMLLKLQRLQQLGLGKGNKISGYSTLSSKYKKQLRDLRVLSSIHPDRDFQCAVIDGIFPNIRKLSLCGSNDLRWGLKHFFAGLPNLLSLKISKSHSELGEKGSIFEGVSVADLPSCLTKVTWKSSLWSKDDMRMLGKCPNLRILKLMDLRQVYYVAEDASFPKLHTLHLENLNEGSFEAHDIDRAFNQLQYLFIKRCQCSFGPELLLGALLKVIEVLPPCRDTDRLKKMKRNGKIKCRLLI